MDGRDAVALAGHEGEQLGEAVEAHDLARQLVEGVPPAALAMLAGGRRGTTQCRRRERR